MSDTQRSDNPPTPVVTSFLLRHRPGGNDEILLVRRSQRVRTYQGAWAGISGYLEAGATPLEQAYTELHEEVGLERDDLELVRSGSPVPVDDESQQLRWLVYPFLFTLSLRQEVPRLDWEALEMRWVEPTELPHYTTVPKLREALAAVYPFPVHTEGQAEDRGKKD
jgi:8-oxo-dGTP pyrophosphatase MutT (NUDIX family)